MAKKRIGKVSAFTAFVITLVPLIVGFSMTGNTIRIPSIGAPVNIVIGWVLVIAGLFSVYAFFTKEKQ